MALKSATIVLYTSKLNSTYQKYISRVKLSFFRNLHGRTFKTVGDFVTESSKPHASHNRKYSVREKNAIYYTTCTSKQLQRC